MKTLIFAIVVFLAGLYLAKDIYFFSDELQAEAEGVLDTIIVKHMFDDYDAGILNDPKGIFATHLGRAVDCGEVYYFTVKNIFSSIGVRWQAEMSCKFTKASAKLIVEVVNDGGQWKIHEMTVSSDALPMPEEVVEIFK